MTMLLFLINPGKQLNKATDSARKEDLKQIRIGLDTYYNDHNCYPTSLSFGHEWKMGNVVYMKKIPQDPSCGKTGSLCYTYVADTVNSCPQWNVLFGKLAIAPSASLPACLLQSDCLPGNYMASGYNLCNFGGNIDCESIQTKTLPEFSESEESFPTPTPIGGPSNPTPTTASAPTPTIVVPPNGLYYCGCGNNHVTVCNVTFSVPQGINYYLDSACSNQCGQSC